MLYYKREVIILSLKDIRAKQLKRNLIVVIPLLLIASVICLMLHDKLGMSCFELLLMLLTSVAIITFSTYLHELGHYLKIMRYSSNAQAAIIIAGIYGKTFSDYYIQLNKLKPSDSEELRDNLLAGVKYSISRCLVIWIVLLGLTVVFQPPCEHLRLWLIVILLSIGISIILQLFNTSDCSDIKNDNDYQYNPGMKSLIHTICNWLAAFSTALLCVVFSFPISDHVFI